MNDDSLAAVLDLIGLKIRRVRLPDGRWVEESYPDPNATPDQLRLRAAWQAGAKPRAARPFRAHPTKRGPGR